MDGAVTEDFRRFDEWRFGRRSDYAVFSPVEPRRIESTPNNNYDLYDALLHSVSNSSPEARRCVARAWAVADSALDDGLAATTGSLLAGPEHLDRRNDAHFRLLNEWLQQCDTI